MMISSYILTLSCPDQPGIVHAVTGLLFQHHSNIEAAAQFSDKETGLFFMRVAFTCPTQAYKDLSQAMPALSAQWKMKAHIHDAHRRMKAIIMVSQYGHCLNDLLFRVRSGLLGIDITSVISNHADFSTLVKSHDLPFHYLPMKASTKQEVEAQQLALINQEKAELIILARYMQILSSEMCQALQGKAINIHHSFLPSFKGAKPYHQAHDRGVKLIGATAHYVTTDLDEGPIIEQDVARVEHSHSIEDLTAVGRDTESQVLARAVKWHSEHRVFLNGHRTVVFK